MQVIMFFMEAIPCRTTKSKAKRKSLSTRIGKARYKPKKKRNALSNRRNKPKSRRQNPKTPLPPPTLSFLAGTLYLQGAMAMGLLPNPVSDKQPAVRIDQARHAIELLTMLQQKTEGNRTPEESEEIEDMLHQLRLAFITVTQK